MSKAGFPPQGIIKEQSINTKLGSRGVSIMKQKLTVFAQYILSFLFTSITNGDNNLLHSTFLVLVVNRIVGYDTTFIPAGWF